jgi:uncharacterized protein YndB with AHSA1/START domain
MTSPSTADREILSIRIFDAPRELVFRMWTDPQYIIHWWGPNGFTTTTHEMDVRPGGVWRFIMHGPDGRDYPNTITYREVVPPERLVYGHGDATSEHFQATVLFEEEGDKTKLTMRMVFPTAAAREQVVKEFGAIEGNRQTLGRLEEYLKQFTNP